MHVPPADEGKDFYDNCCNYHERHSDLNFFLSNLPFNSRTAVPFEIKYEFRELRWPYQSVFDNEV